MAERRKPLSKKIRFEVFKRDKFTCQYCGRMSPDVILEVDHIKPVAEGGTNDVLNLVTSCRDCNRGKGKRKLSDASEVKKQQERIKELAEKNEQLQMMLQWREEILQTKQDEVESICDYIQKHYGVTIADTGKKKVKAWLREFPLAEILESVDISFERYHDGSLVSANMAFDKIGGVCHNRSLDQKGDKSNYYYQYLKKACNNNLPFCNDEYLKELVRAYVHDDDDFDRAKKVVHNARSWMSFCMMIKGEDE